METKTEESKIDEQIDKIRNLDLETSKPRLHPSKPEKTVKKTESTKTKSQTSIFAILTPYLRNPCVSKSEPQTSTYVPNAFYMYFIIHHMDDLMRRSFYFKRQEDAWHPLITRLYFGILFIIQTLRAELKAGTISSRNKRFVTRFLRNYSPESLNIPGPLVALFESINPTRPSNTLFGQVSPTIFDQLIDVSASDLLNYDEAHSYILGIPNIPGILGFLHKLTSAQPANIPDYTIPATFSNNVDQTLNGHLFQANNWNEIERAFLLTPGLLYAPETNREIDTTFNRYGNRLSLPVPAADDNIRNISNYCYLNVDDDWFGNVAQIMATYSNYFIGSVTLAQCSANSTSAPLIVSEFTKASTPLPADNPLHTLTRAFHPTGVFSFEFQHSTTELNVAPNNAMIATGTKTNCITHLDHLGHYSTLGHNLLCRNGPYWLHHPLQRISSKETTYKSIGSLISEKYLLMRPKQPKEQ